MPASLSPYAKRLAEIRRQYPNAYKLWTAEEEQLLLQGVQEGESSEILANRLKRQPSAIRSRLGKLGGNKGIQPAFPAAELTGEKPFYEVIHQDLAQARDSLRVTFEADWQRVESAPGVPYIFRSVCSAYMLARYGRGCIYRWGVYTLEAQDLYAIYIGSTKRLCPDRLVGYLNPTNSPTNQRIYSQLIGFQLSGYIVSLEILQRGQIVLDDLKLDCLDFGTQRDRLFIEYLLVIYYRLKGQRLLNL